MHFFFEYESVFVQVESKCLEIELGNTSICSPEIEGLICHFITRQV